MRELGGKDLLATWDAIQFGLLVHRSVADTMGYSVDLALGFDARARAALRQLTDAEADEVSGVHGTTRSLMLADARRRAAVLAAYLDLGEDDARRRFDQALEAYSGVVRIGTGQTLSDEFSQVLTGLERTLTLRHLARFELEDQTGDRSQTNLESLGLLHLVDELRADAVKGRIFLARPTQPVATEVLNGAKGPTRERAHLELALGLARLHNGDRAASADSARRAMDHLNSAHYGLFDQMERHFDLIVVSWTLGMTADDLAERLQALDSTVKLIEEVRGGWQLGSTPSDPTWKPLQRILSSCLRAACTTDHPTSGWVAMRIAEAMRRRHLAGMLRSVRFAQSDSEHIRRSIVVALTDLVSLAEDQQLRTASMAVGAEMGGVEVYEFERDADGIIEKGSEQSEVAESRLRAELAEAVSGYFADAFLPEHVEIAAMQKMVKGWHVLAFTSLEGSDMARVWVDPSGHAVADVIDISGCAERAAEFDWLGSSAPTWVAAEYESQAFQFSGEDVAEFVSARLLPAELRQGLADGSRGLVVVPDHWLSRVAWPALIDSGRREIVRVLDVAIVPSISLLRELVPSSEGFGRGAGACLDYAASLESVQLDVARERAALTSFGAEPHPSIRELFHELLQEEGDQRWAYVACHGADPTLDQDRWQPEAATGLGVELIEVDGSRVTFLDMLAVPWPQLVCFAGCFTARLNWAVQTGLAPLGLAVSTLAHGADTTIGSTDELPDHTAELFVGWESDGRKDVGVLGRAIRGIHPVRALADAQRAWLDRGGDYAAPVLWARAVAVSQRLPDS